jgi:hypothetical protein
VPETLVSGETSDISPFCELEWYQWVKFRDTQTPFLNDKMLGRYLGPSFDVGPAMCVKILKSNGQIVHRLTYQALNNNEMGTRVEVEAMELFDWLIVERFGHNQQAALDDVPMDKVESPTHDLYMDDDSKSGVKALDDYDDIVDTYDQYIGAQVNLPHGNVYTAGNVRLRKRDVDGNLIGRAHANPILDTRVYEVEFPDGERVEYAANVIAECMYAQCDAEGNQFLMMDGIEDHRRTSDAMSVTEMFVDVNGRHCIKQSTKGWLLSVKWKDGTSSWENLCDVKESYPVQCAEYAVARSIDKEPAFVWWVSYTLKTRD